MVVKAKIFFLALKVFLFNPSPVEWRDAKHYATIAITGWKKQ